MGCLSDGWLSKTHSTKENEMTVLKTLKIKGYVFTVCTDGDEDGFYIGDEAGTLLQNEDGAKYHDTEEEAIQRLLDDEA